MNFNDDMEIILEYAHYWNWCPDLIEFQKIYNSFPNSFSVLTPFAYSYLEECIRSTTSDYGIEILDESGKTKKRQVGRTLISLAKNENISNTEYVKLLDELKLYLLNKQAIFVGNSGVGKSSLTNAIMDDDEIKTSHVSDKSKRGRHTTTASKYYIWNDNSSIIDTPGIRSLDVSSFSPIEIQDYFPELDNWKDKCKYNDCLHYHEPYDSCVVKQGVASGLINRDRFESYLRIMCDVLGEKNHDEIMNEIFPEKN